MYRRQHEYIHIRFINDPIRFIRTVPVNGESLGYQVIEIERDRYRHQQDEQLSRNENRMGDYFQIFLIGGIDDDFGFFRFNFDIVGYFPTTDLFPFLQVQQEGKEDEGKHRDRHIDAGDHLHFLSIFPEKKEKYWRSKQDAPNHILVKIGFFQLQNIRVFLMRGRNRHSKRCT